MQSRGNNGKQFTREQGPTIFPSLHACKLVAHLFSMSTLPSGRPGLSLPLASELPRRMPLPAPPSPLLPPPGVLAFLGTAAGRIACGRASLTLLDATMVPDALAGSRAEGAGRRRAAPEPPSACALGSAALAGAAARAGTGVGAWGGDTDRDSCVTRDGERHWDTSGDRRKVSEPQPLSSYTTAPRPNTDLQPFENYGLRPYRTYKRPHA